MNLANMARVYRRSLLTFYLPAPPQKGDRGEDFRNVVAERSIAAEVDIDALLRDLRARQSLVRAILEDEEDTLPLDFVGSARVKDGTARLCLSIKQQLGITRTEYRAQGNAGAAFALLRDKAEQAGIFVLLAGNLGSHHSAIPVEAFRGFAIADKITPFIVINDGDAKAAWSFTLLHELAHLWLGASGVSGGGHQQKVIERFCNDVAGDFLLPQSDLETVRVAGLDIDQQIALITDCANRWRVSLQMVAYGLYVLDANVLITAHNQYYPIDAVAEYWGGLVHVGSQGLVKMPYEIFDEVKDGPGGETDLLFAWLRHQETKAALLLPDMVDPVLVR